MDTITDGHTGQGGGAAAADITDRPPSRLSVREDRPSTPAGSDGGPLRPSTPIYLKKAKRQAPKPPARVTSGAGVNVTVSSDNFEDISQSSDMEFKTSSKPPLPPPSPLPDTAQHGHYQLHNTAQKSPLSHFSDARPQYQVGTNYSNAPLPGVSRVMVRLIDEAEYEDPDSYNSDNGDFKPKTIHAKLSTSPVPLTATTTTATASHFASNYYPVNHPGEFPDPVITQGLNDITLPSVQNDVTIRRCPPRRLMHSASDPGVGRSRLGGGFTTYGRPSKCTPTPPPLEQLSEAEEENENANYPTYSDYENQLRQALSSNRRLERSDSLVTVAHLCEDLVVAPKLRVKVTLTNLTAVVVIAAFIMPNTATLLYVGFRLVFGTLFPAYYSYKAVKTKNVKEYVQWMMYWIVFAFFTCFETLTDVFLSFWFPFYYEIKILVVLWLLSPATRGSSVLYRKFVHPWLTQREDNIDDCIAKAKQQGYTTVVQLTTKGVNYATNVLMQTAIKGGGGIVSQLKRSYSTGEIGEEVDIPRNLKALLRPEDHSYDDLHQQHQPDPYDSDRVRSDNDQGYRPRGSSMGRVARAGKARSADISEVYYQDVPDEVPRRRSPRTADNARSPPTLHFQEPPPKETRKRGKSENRQRPKSMINAADVSRGAEWARQQQHLGSTLSLASDVELSESSSHSSLASVAASLTGQHQVRPKGRSGSARRPRVNSQGRDTRRGGGSIVRSSSRGGTKGQGLAKSVQKTSLDVASDSE